MQTTGRLQSLLTLEQLKDAERWRDEHILPAVANAWEARGTGGWAGVYSACVPSIRIRMTSCFWRMKERGLD